MEKILIIKLNASGDVLRTTVLLHVLKGKIFWITAGYNVPLFPEDYPDLTVIPLESITSEIFSINFDLVINLEEDAILAQTVNTIQTKKLIGIYWREGHLQYSADSAELFDMSLISKLSISEANNLKRQNTRSYQEIICGMVAKPFSGEPYIIYKDNLLNSGKVERIGIEERVGSRWPNKYWHGYRKLKEILLEDNCDVVVFEQRAQLRQYMKDIQQCRLLITGDTLAMHVALGYGVPCVAIFNCTSPVEIFDYGILEKIISPKIDKFFYNTEFCEEAVTAIPIEQVKTKVYNQLNLAMPSHSTRSGK